MLRKINVFMIYVPSYGGCCPVPFSVIHALIKIDLLAGDSLQTRRQSPQKNDVKNIFDHKLLCHLFCVAPESDSKERNSLLCWYYRRKAHISTSYFPSFFVLSLIGNVSLKSTTPVICVCHYCPHQHSAMHYNYGRVKIVTDKWFVESHQPHNVNIYHPQSKSGKNTQIIKNKIRTQHKRANEMRAVVIDKHFAYKCRVSSGRTK